MFGKKVFLSDVFVKIFGLIELINVYYHTERKREREDFYNHGYANVKSLNQFRGHAQIQEIFPFSDM